MTLRTPFIAALVSGLLAATAAAQAPAPALLETYTLRTGFSGASDFESGREADVTQFEFSTSGRLPVGSIGMGIVGLSYRTYQIDVDGIAAVPDSLNEVALTLGLQRRLAPDWSGFVQIRPGFYGDFETIDGDSFNVPLLAVAQYSARPGLIWSFGVTANAFSEIPVLPIAGVRWAFAPDWTFNLGFPRIDVTQKVNESFSWSVLLRIEGGNYRVTDSPPTPFPGPASLRNTYVDFTEIRTGVGLNYALTDTIRLDLEAGVMTDRKFDYYDRDYQLNGDPAGFVTLGITGRF